MLRWLVCSSSSFPSCMRCPLAHVLGGRQANATPSGDAPTTTPVKCKPVLVRKCMGEVVLCTADNEVKGLHARLLKNSWCGGQRPPHLSRGVASVHYNIHQSASMQLQRNAAKMSISDRKFQQVCYVYDRCCSIIPSIAIKLRSTAV